MAYYPFIVTRDIGGVPERVAVLYHHRNGGESGALEEAIELLTNRRLSPSRVLVVCGFGREAEIKRQFDALDEATRARLGVTSHILVLPYGMNGEALPKHSIEVVGAGWAVEDTELEIIAKNGLRQLIDETGVILKAPRGYVFRKPSGSTSRRFIRTGNMFREPSALALTSHLLMRRLPAELSTLFIDSFTILSPALAFVRERELIARSAGLEWEEPSISNFHSYSIDPDLRFPGHARYAVLISASTSGRLGDKLVEEHGANPETLHYILILSSDPDLDGRAIYYEKSELEGKPVAQAFRREISIPGEEFIASSGEPHAVKITKSHFARLEQKTLALPYYQKSLSVNLAAPGHAAYSLIGLGPATDGDNPDFDKWVEEEVEHSIPPNVAWILAVESGASLVLAERIADLLVEHLGRKLEVFELQGAKAGELPDTGDGRTVLVVSATTGVGEELLSASRTLRDIKHRHRHYLVGHVFPESASQFDRLQNNLRVSGRSRKYGWSAFMVSPLGQVDGHDSWRIEHEALKRGMAAAEVEELDRGLRELLATRVGNLSAQSISGEQLFLPRPDLQPLKLRQESVLFSRAYENVSHVTVYLMVSAALQRARDHLTPEGEALDEEMCFHGSPFIASLLDPDMFSRFNDGVIQAAFLRACAPDEMNYASHHILSRNVRDVLVAAIAHFTSDAGEAVLEMLFALATKRLRLMDEHYEQVLVAVRGRKLLSGFWSVLKAEDTF